MNERIHACLDGELPREALSEEERRQLAAYERAVAAGVGAVPNDPGPDLTEGVMARVAAAPAPWEARRAGEDRSAAGADRAPVPTPRGKGAPPARGGVASAVRWLWRPRQVTLRPGLALAAAALLAALLLVPRGGASEPAVPVQQGGTAVAAGTEAGPVRVHFRLDAPEAGAVSLAGSFTEWEASVALEQELPGVWTVVVPLEPGVHDYAFVVDGAWVTDPMAQQVDDGFGGVNSRVAVVRRGT